MEIDQATLQNLEQALAEVDLSALEQAFAEVDLSTLQDFENEPAARKIVQNVLDEQSVCPNQGQQDKNF